ncbi:MAG TPA: lipid-A-disaccharide synthase [bacterium]|mgnify:CR=1 FL=1|nr:lipid-A-disaccharide synthase [bacterium]
MKIALLAGEVSGDNYGALLARHLLKLQPGLTLIGLGGQKMRQAGLRILQEMPPGRMGWSGVLLQLPGYYRLCRQTVSQLLAEKPDLIVFIDNPGFNLALARAVGKNFPCYYYIPPKVWAHGKNRLKILREYVRAVIPIFPFEPAYYQKEGILCHWFGHPIIDLIDFQADTEDLEKKCLVGKNEAVVGILPGSRPQEIEYLMPEFLWLSRKITVQSKVKIIFSAVDQTVRKLESQHMNRVGVQFPIWEGPVYPLLKRASLLLATCGTANLEIALLDKPFLIFYRTSWFNYAVARAVVKLSAVSPVNIILGETAVPEHLQFIHRKVVLEQTMELLRKGNLYHRQLLSFQKLKKLLTGEAVTEKVARFLLSQSEASTRTGSLTHAERIC